MAFHDYVKQLRSFVDSRIITVIFCAALLISVADPAQAITPWYASCGAHTVILKPDGTVWTMGRNDFGQLGNDSPVDYAAEPARVVFFDDAIAVAAGLTHSVALRRDGSVWTWGFNGSGQLGDGTVENRAIPVRVVGLHGVVAIASGHSHVVALKKDGTVWGWGSNSWGQLGKAAGEANPLPVMISDMKDVISVTSGSLHTTLLKRDGTVWSIGYNSLGQLGDGTTFESAVPVKAAGLSQVVAISGGNHHTVALRNDGTLWVWGCNNYGQLGDAKSRERALRPTQVNAIGRVMDISAKANHTYAILKDGTVWGWGDKGPEIWSNSYLKRGNDTPYPLRGASGNLPVTAIGNPATLLDHKNMSAVRNSGVSEIAMLEH